MTDYFKALATIALLASASPAVYAQEETNGNEGAAAVAQPTLEQSMGPVTVDEIVGFDEGRSLIVIPVEQEGVSGSDDEVGIEAMVDDQSADFGAILDAIEENPVIYDQLRAKGYERSDIFAVGMDNGGALTIRVHADGE